MYFTSVTAQNICSKSHITFFPVFQSKVQSEFKLFFQNPDLFYFIVETFEMGYGPNLESTNKGLHSLGHLDASCQSNLE